MENKSTLLCSPTSATIPSLSLQAALDRLQAQTINTVPNSIYIFDLVNQHSLYLTSPLAELLGYTLAQIDALGPIGMANLIHPVDLQRVAEHYQQFTSLLETEVIVVEYRMKRTDGDWCWLRSQETPLILAIDGFPLQVLGLLQDITHRPTDPFDSTARTINALEQNFSSQNRARL